MRSNPPMHVTERYCDLAAFFQNGRLDDHPAPEMAGEVLVQRGLISRSQLFRALQMQDRLPGVRLGDCVIALGFADAGDIHALIGRR